MKILELTARDVTPRLFSRLEKRSLIKTLKPTRRVTVSGAQYGAMQSIYCSHARFGTHKLICIKKNSDQIKLNYHPDNEEFILINNTGRSYRPLYIVIALYKQRELARKIKRASLKASDFLCLRMRFNDPRTCFFTMLKNTVHCEVTSCGRGSGPVFFVSEPSRLRLHTCRTPGYMLGLTAKKLKRRTA